MAATLAPARCFRTAIGTPRGRATRDGRWRVANAGLKRVLAGMTLAGAIATGAPAQQDWGFAGPLMAEAFSTAGRAVEGSFWLPNDVDPARAIYAIGVAYPAIEGSAGSVEIKAGVFGRLDSGWTFLAPLRGLFGFDPRDTVWHGEPAPTRVELTTTTLQPGEPRCCPTGETRWSVALQTGQAQRLN